MPTTDPSTDFFPDICARVESTRQSRQREAGPVSLFRPEDKPTRTIEVLQVDIDGAGIGVGNCPTARALRRTYGIAGDVKVFVWTGHAQIGETVYALPMEANRPESWWNKTRTMEPHTFLFDDQNPIDTI